MQLPQYQRMFRALLARSATPPKDTSRLESASKIVQIVSTVGTFAILIYGAVAITRLDNRIKVAELPSKVIGASYDKQHRIRIEHTLSVEPIKSSDGTEAYEASLAFKCTNTSRAAYTIRRVEIEFFKGELAPPETGRIWFKVNPPLQLEGQPIRWTALQTDAYVSDKDELNALRDAKPSAKIHGQGPTGYYNSDETADWEENYRFSGALGDFVGFVISVNYEAEGPWVIQEWGSVPKTPAEKTTASKVIH